MKRYILLILIVLTQIVISSELDDNKKLCEKGIAEGCYNLGYMYEHGKGVKKDAIEGYGYYTRGYYNRNNQIKYKSDSILLTSYTTKISDKDHYSKSNRRLNDIAFILQQDRANYHKYHKRDKEDSHDDYFKTKVARDTIKTLLANGFVSEKTMNAILQGTPLVKVNVYKGYIDVIAEKIKNSMPIMVGGNNITDACPGKGLIKGIQKDVNSFVAIHSGPGTNYPIIDKFYNNFESAYMCDEMNEWVSIIYGGEDCGVSSSIVEGKHYDGPCKSGWISQKNIVIYAG